MERPGKSLLIGNGVNRLSNDSVSWENVLKELVQTNNFPKESLNLIPNTIFFECIKFQSSPPFRTSEAAAQQRIANMMAAIQPNPYHARFLESGVKHIFTTNYDYSLEKAAAAPADSSGNETKYSLFRRKKVGELSIWHIHGEIDRPKTIMLGFDHYAGCLQKMRKHLVGELESDEEKALIALASRLSGEEPKEPAWVEIFLRDQVDIIGLTLDFTEIDLWWLLGLKKMMGLLKDGIAGKTRYIHFYLENQTGETEARLAAMKLYGIEILEIPVKSNQWEQAYTDYLNEVHEIS